MKYIILWALLFAPFVWYWVANYRRSTRTDRKLDRKAREEERAETDRLYEMKQRNIQLQKFRK